MADLLARLLDEPHLEVVVDATSGTVEVDSDVLVTTTRQGGSSARAVVLLDDPIAPGVATVLADGSTDQVEVLDLEAVAALVRTLCPGPD